MIHCIKESGLFRDMPNDKPAKNPALKICFVLLDRSDEKKDVKKFLDGAGIVSQFVLKGNI